MNRLSSEQTEKETEDYESTQDVSVNSADTRSVALVKLSDESGAEDRRYSVDDSPDQETSQSLISHSWTRDPDSSSAESSIDRSAKPMRLIVNGSVSSLFKAISHCRNDCLRSCSSRL